MPDDVVIVMDVEEAAAWLRIPVRDVSQRSFKGDPPFDCSCPPGRMRMTRAAVRQIQSGKSAWNVVANVATAQLRRFGRLVFTSIPRGAWRPGPRSVTR
jgi:hypothetical protein